MEGFFTLNSAADLREKLRRDLAKLRAAPTNIDSALNFFITAEHMADWVHPGKAGRAAREALRDSSLLLQVCSHLANGGKHFRVEAKHHDSVARTRRVGGITTLGRYALGTRPLGGGRPTCYVDLQGDAAAALGPSIEVITLARCVMAFWDAHPLA